MDDEDKIKARLEIAEKELEQAKVEGFHDKIIVNDDLQQTYEQLERYIFGQEDDIAAEERIETSEVVNEVEMAEVLAGDDAKSLPNGGPAPAVGRPVKENPSDAEEEESSK